MKKLYHKYKREIWVGVVVSIITGIISKFGNWLVEVTPAIGTTIFDTLTNIIYSFAATYTDNFLLRIFLVCVLGFSGVTLYKSIAIGLKLYKGTLRLQKNTKNFSSKQLEKINKQVLDELDDEQDENAENTVPELIKKGKDIGQTAIILIAFMVSLYMFIVFFVSSPIFLYNKFERDLVKIAPYVEDDDIKQLKSDWVCMRSKDDYNDIYQFIDDTIDSYSLPD